MLRWVHSTVHTQVSTLNTPYSGEYTQHSILRWVRILNTQYSSEYVYSTLYTQVSTYTQHSILKWVRSLNTILTRIDTPIYSGTRKIPIISSFLYLPSLNIDKDWLWSTKSLKTQLVVIRTRIYAILARQYTKCEYGIWNISFMPIYLW